MNWTQHPLFPKNFPFFSVSKITRIKPGCQYGLYSEKSDKKAT